MNSEDLQRTLGQLSEAAAKLAQHLAAREDPPAPKVEASPAPRDCMTKAQLAEYFQCSEVSITNWQKRADNPLPCGYVGDSPRFYLAEVKQWSHEEKERRKGSLRNKTDQGAKKQITKPEPARKMRATLMAAN